MDPQHPQPRTHHEPDPRFIQVVVLPAIGDPHLAVIEARLQTYWRIVGGYIQVVPLRVAPGVTIFCNEDGKNLGLPVNIFASAVAHLVPSSLRSGDMLVGACLLVGSANPRTGEVDGLEHDVPLTVVDLLRSHGVPIHDARP